MSDPVEDADLPLPTLSMKNEERKPKVIHSAIAGLTGGSVCAIVFCPIDVVRVRRAVKHLHESSRIIAKEMYLKEGIKSFYSGLGATLLALGPNWSVYFASYEFLKQYNSKWMDDGPLLHILSAVPAAAITDLTVNPLWMVKTRLQTQGIRGEHKYRGIVHATSLIVKEEGFRALWAGVVPQLIGAVHVAIQFPIYEKLKIILKNKNNENNMSGFVWNSLIASGVSKVIASTIAYPHEVLRTKFQYQLKTDPNHHHSLRDACRVIYLEEGIRGFYKGMGTNLFRVVPSCAVTFSIYEFVLRSFSSK